MNSPRPSERGEGGPDDARTGLRLSLEELRLPFDRGRRSGSHPGWMDTAAGQRRHRTGFPV